jgi:hypothetical protein
VTVGFVSDQATHHTGKVTGLEVILRRFGGGNRGRGDRIIGVIIDGSLLLGLAATGPVISRRGNAWTGFGSLSLRALGGGGRRRRGIGVVVAIPTVGATRGLGSELRNSGTGEFVGSVGEGVDEDTGVIVLVGTGEFDEFFGAGGAGLIATDVDLNTASVELGTSRLVGQMKGDDLVTKEVSTASEGRRKRERMGLSVELILLDPATIAFTGFIDLEPLSVGGVELVA